MLRNSQARHYIAAYAALGLLANCGIHGVLWLWLWLRLAVELLLKQGDVDAARRATERFLNLERPLPEAGSQVAGPIHRQCAAVEGGGQTVPVTVPVQHLQVDTDIASQSRSGSASGTNRHGAGVSGDSGDILLFDTFPFNGDSIAELRLAVMAPYVDHIYVVEAWQPHAARADTQSARKPYLYSELPRWQAVWRQYGDKVLPVTPSLTRRAATTV